MSLTRYKDCQYQIDNRKLLKNAFIIKKPIDTILLERVFTSSNQRRMTNIKEGLVLSIPENTGIIIFLNGKVIDYCDIPGNYVYSEKNGENISRDAVLNKMLNENIAEFEKNISELKFKPKEYQVYSINMDLISSNIFSINTPINFRDVVYGQLLMRYYGKIVVRISNPFQLLRMMLINKIEVYTLNRIFEETQDEFIGYLSQSLSEISINENISFMKLPEIQGEITERMIERMNDGWYRGKGISLLSVQMISILPTIESRELIENKRKKIQKYNEIFGKEKSSSYLNIH